MRNSLVAGLVMVGIGSGIAHAGDKVADVTKQLKDHFPGMAFTKVEASPIDDLYEVQAGQNIVYFYPKKDLLVFGEIWNREGKSLTGLKRQETAARLIKDLPLDKAVKIGNGKNVVIEFTDPDCPFCRKADGFLKGRKDVTRYVFFTPLSIHPQAASKAMYILTAQNREKAHEEVFGGKLDSKPVEVKNDVASKLLIEHQAWGAKLGVNGTPAFWINGTPVAGANIPAMTKLLGGGAVSSNAPK